jgi:PIN domain-containing protein
VPPDNPVFFVDADLSDKWFFRVLEEAGIAFERHDDHFSPGTDDLDWLARAGQEDWVVLSHNKKLRKVTAQTERLMEAGVRAIMLIGDPGPNPPGERSVFTRDLAENFVRTLPQILRFLKRHPGPWIAKLYRPDPTNSPGGPGTIKIWLTLQAWLKER